MEQDVIATGCHRFKQHRCRRRHEQNATHARRRIRRQRQPGAFRVRDWRSGSVLRDGRAGGLPRLLLLWGSGGLRRKLGLRLPASVGGTAPLGGATASWSPAVGGAKAPSARFCRGAGFQAAASRHGTASGVWTETRVWTTAWIRPKTRIRAKTRTWSKTRPQAGRPDVPARAVIWETQEVRLPGRIERERRESQAAPRAAKPASRAVNVVIAAAPIVMLGKTATGAAAFIFAGRHQRPMRPRQ